MAEDWSRIPPGSAPGGLVFRVTAAGHIWRDRPITAPGPELEAWAEADAQLAIDLAEQYGEARQFIYDGDSGECVSTVIVA